jgi:hypothetical protein
MAQIDWSKLGFGFTDVNCHIRYVWKDGEWDKGELVKDPFITMHIGASCLHYGQECFEQRRLAQERRDELNRRALEEAMHREEAARRAEEARQKKIAALNAEKELLNTELQNLKGLFTGKRRKEIEVRILQIDNELKGM